MRDFDVWPSMAAHSYLLSIYVKNKQHELAWAEYEAMKALSNASLPGNVLRVRVLVAGVCVYARMRVMVCLWLECACAYLLRECA
jgi:hypothetical protein